MNDLTFLAGTQFRYHLLKWEILQEEYRIFLWGGGVRGVEINNFILEMLHLCSDAY